MIGLVVVTHGELGDGLIRAAETILGKIPRTAIVSINVQDDPEVIRGQIQEAIESVEDSDGVLILTDMFGGTPSNCSLAFLEADKVEVLTGVNLPAIIKIAEQRQSLDLAGLARTARDYGRRAISIAGEILSKDIGD